MSVLMNVRVPEELKDTFQIICRENHTYMTTEIIRFIKRFVNDEIIDLPPPPKLAKPTFTKPTLENMWGDVVTDSDTTSWESSYD